jgi:hypothetical protein
MRSMRSNTEQSRRRRWLFVALGVAVCFVGAATLWMVRAPVHDELAIPSFFSPGMREVTLAREAEWSRAEFVPADQDPALTASRWDSSVEDPDELITHTQRADLLAMLAAHAHASAQPTPDAYLEMAARQPQHRWREPGPELRNGFVYSNYQGEFGRELVIESDADRVDALRLLWQRIMAEKGNRFEQVGVAERGAIIVVRRLRTNAPSNGLEQGDEERFIYWDQVALHGGARSYRTGLPPGADLTDRDVSYRALVLDRRPSATVAFVHVIVRLHNGVIFNWQSEWVLDPDSGAWVCDYMGDAAGRAVRGVVF